MNNEIPENNAWHNSQEGWEKYYQEKPNQSLWLLIPVAIEAAAFYFLNHNYQALPYINVVALGGILWWLDLALVTAMAANLLLIILHNTIISNLIYMVEYSAIVYALVKLLIVFPFNLDNLSNAYNIVILALVIAIIVCGLLIISHLVKLAMGSKD